MEQQAKPVDMDTIVSLCKRRGFIFQSSEIYGGLGSCWDYGPLGVELKRNVKEAWWRAVVYNRDDMVGLDASIMMHPQVWVASGHVESFTDPLVECKACHLRFRADDVHLAAVKFEGESYIPVISVEASKREMPSLQQLEKETEDWLQALKQKFQESWPQLLEKTKSVAKKKGKKIVEVEPLFNLASFSPIEEVPCPSCDTKGSLTEPRYFNLMFKTYMGALDVEEELLEEISLIGQAELGSQMQRLEALKERLDRARVYLRPETAQGIFVNFDNVLTTSRKKIPFGIAQIGKAFRNEITTGNFTFRSREFEQMEIEYFIKPGTDKEWLDKWVQERFQWYLDLGIRKENLRQRQHGEDELAHYAKDCYDIEYLFPMGWSELEGIANRGDFDLVQHAQHSGKSLDYHDDETGERYVPYIIEPSGGVDRAALAFLIDAYHEEEVKGEKRVVLRFHKDLAPVKVAVLPLSRHEKLVPLAREVYDMLRGSWNTQYDDAQSIGRRYRRQDEIGTPFCVTIDFDSLEDKAVTIRERDSMDQERIPIAELKERLREKLG